MALHWMHLLPVDRYIVRTSSFISDLDRKVVTLLYQPLIGAIAHSLFFALLSELEKDQFLSEETTHKTLMTMTGLPLDKIFEERKKLEGIGLLNVYKKKQEDDITYLYEVQKPFGPVEFFKDDVLSVYLYNRVGKHRYLQLRDRFSLAKIDKDEYQETTMSFSDVFTSLHHSEISAQQGELAASIKLDKSFDIIDHVERSHIHLLENSFDFSLLSVHLSSMIDFNKAITNEVKEAIVRLAFVYRIDPLQMSKLIQDSLILDDQVDLEILRTKVKNWYRFTQDNEPPGLGMKTQPAQFKTMAGKVPTTLKEEMIQLFETESPLSILENKCKGAKVPLSDVKIVESLLLDFKLLPGVANVLIDYVLNLHDMKLPKSYVEKIAGQWARKNVKTVVEAMELAKSEYQQRNIQNKAATEIAATTNEKAAPRKQTSKYIRQERLPKWLTEEKKATSTNEDEDLTAVREELEEKLKQLKQNRQ